MMSMPWRRNSGEATDTLCMLGRDLDEYIREEDLSNPETLRKIAIKLKRIAVELSSIAIQIEEYNRASQKNS